MKYRELFNMYLNLSARERIKFDTAYSSFQNQENLERQRLKSQVVQDLNQIVDENGKTYFSAEWIKTNVLKVK